MARIVNVSSCAHVLGTTDFEDINNRETYISGRAYAQSKLALVLFTKHLDNLLKTENVFVQAHSVHPGMVNTDLFNGTVLKSLAPWVPALFFKDPQQGAIPIVYACLSSDLEGKGGTYITNCQVTASSKITYSIELQERLFNITKKLLKIEQFGVPN
ncbi:hypothetical protein NQ318_009001 [Aromia moschata]|uniref:Uncharacterized protein n=1 Tax=Aromia moschata TaxID=1265417 RepID=A0AAV8XDR5_9CUCU|nr:hypothetical protein NQ318_009001 [Aromia moschata]